MTESILEFMNSNQWEKAASEVARQIKQNGFDDTLAILAATVAAHFEDMEAMLTYIEGGLEYNSSNYELYLMLGNYFVDINTGLAYLCYENAQYFCSKTAGVDSEDYALIMNAKELLMENQDLLIPPVSIVVVSHNTLDLTRLCIDSIRKTCMADIYELIVVDNASVDGSREWLQDQPDIHLIINDENLGYPAGCNQGIRAAAEKNDIWLLQSDTVATPNSLFNLRMGLYKAPEHGIAGSVANCAGNHQIIEKTFEKMSDYMGYAAINNIPGENVLEYKTWLSGFSILLKRRMIEKAGLLDERYTPGYYEDMDLCVRCLYAGYRNVLCWNSFIYHWGGRSFGQYNGGDCTELVNRSRQKFIDKWGVELDYYCNVRTELIALIKQEAGQPLSVLEVGCGTGSTIGRIEYLYSDAEVYGIELVEPVAELAGKNFNVICGNIETMDLPYEKDKFDYIIFGDVLEHLREPENVLRRLKPYLKKGGSILASIPNLMNAEVIYKLLHGDFTYEDLGIRDRTHLRFFTYNEIVRMFERLEYQIDTISYIKVEDGSTDVYKEFFEQLLAIDGVAERNMFDAYQYLVKADR